METLSFRSLVHSGCTESSHTLTNTNQKVGVLLMCKTYFQSFNKTLVKIKYLLFQGSGTGKKNRSRSKDTKQLLNMTADDVIHMCKYKAVIKTCLGRWCWLTSLLDFLYCHFTKYTGVDTGKKVCCYWLPGLGNIECK